VVLSVPFWHNVWFDFHINWRKLPWLSFAAQRLHYPCLHTFVIVGRSSFDVDIFPLVIILLFHLIIIFNFCLPLFEKYMIWFLSAMICVSGTRDIYRAFLSGNVIHCRPSPSWLCMWIIPYCIMTCANIPFSLSFPRQ